MSQTTLLILAALSCVALGENTAPNFQLSSVGHVMLGVANLPAALSFYHHKLGLKTNLAGDDLAFVDAGCVSLVLSTEVGKAPGDTEIVFDVAHVQQAYEGLTRNGVNFSNKPHQISADSWAANFRDLDGHNLSIFGPI